MKTTPSLYGSNVVRFILPALLMSRLLSAANGDADDMTETLLAKMTLAEKIGQMTQVDSSALKDKSHIQKYALGSVLSGGGSDPVDNSVKSWLQMVTECREWALQTRLKIPLLYGIDAVHGHNNVEGAVIFPHNIGLGATRNPSLVEQAARITAREMAGTGIDWNFAPCVAVAENPRWGRTYESYSDSPDLAGELGAAAVRGFQAGFSESTSVIACAKHFLGDGGTQGGKDQGNTVLDEASLRKIHLAPYLPAIKAGVGTIMASFSSWNGAKVHGNKHLLTDILKNELGFKGFVVSDWAAIDQLPHDYKGNIAAAINAGIDMAMVPNGPGQRNNYVDFITKLTELVNEGRVPQARIDDAVRRILRVKFESGAFERKVVDPALTDAIGSESHRAVARECVRQSLVLLKNSNTTLPLSKDFKHIHVVGRAADDLGMQCGGWTISWQGAMGKVTPGGTTLLQAIRQTVGGETKVSYSADGGKAEGADVVIAVIGETPYAEGNGDRKDLQLSSEDTALITRAKAGGTPVVTVLLSGRPLVLGNALDISDAFLVAWLPGTEGQGMADVIFGDYQPTGKLPRAWPKGPQDVQAADLFPFGYGLAYGTAKSSARQQARN